MPSTHYTDGERVSENWDTVFKALSAEPRRQLIVSLLDAPADQSVPLPQSAAMPNLPVNSEALRIELYHAHLPILEKNDFITFETEPLTASRGPKFDEVAVVFDALHSESATIPDQLVIGCQRLEQERQDKIDRR